MTVTPLFIFDMFMQMWQGNIVAWFAFSLLIATCILIALLIGVWWKLPQAGRRLLLNNLWGHNPVLFNAYDTRMAAIETPNCFREGITHSRDGGFSFIPRLTDETGKLLSPSEQSLITKAFFMKGLNVPLYVGYSGKATIVNPELQAFLENAEVFTKKGNPHNVVHVPRQAFINALQSMKDDMVQVAPMWVTQLVDPRKLKENISKAWNKSQLVAMEMRIREEMRAQLEGTVIKTILIVSLIGVVVSVFIAAKQFGLM